MNSTQRLAAQRYAAAYDALSTTSEEASQRCAQLRAAQTALASQARTMTSPRISLQAKKEAVRAALAGAPQTAAFIELLLEAKRYELLGEITRRVAELLDARLGIIRAQVYAATPLSEAQKRHTEQVLSQRYGGRVEAEFQTDAALLGGLKIDCRGEQIDGTLQSRLLKLEEELTK